MNPLILLAAGGIALYLMIYLEQQHSKVII